MPRKDKKLSTGSLLGEVTQLLGIDGSGETARKKNKTALSRKEKRKLERSGKKQKKKIYSELRTASSISHPGDAQEEKAAIKKTPTENIGTDPRERKEPAKKKAKMSAPAVGMISEDPEDEEIARLERLLGLKKDESARRKVAVKLNKEYAQFEGLGDDFGDFLLGLDDIVKSDKPQPSNSKYYEDSDEAPSDGELGMVPDLVDDDEYPDSDISYDEGMEVETEASTLGSSESESDEEDQNSFDGSAGPGDVEYYTPAQGQDIYGNDRSGEDADGAATKYVPPHMRNKAVAVINEQSEKYVMLRRVMNGLLNRLSDETKDSIVRSLKDLFDSNSQLECCHCLNKCIMAACSNSTQVMVTLIPMYAAIVAGLHISVSVAVGANLLELLAVTFHKVSGLFDKMIM